MRLLASLLSVLVYCTVITILMYANSVYFNFGDQKSGEGGWRIYWYVWAAFYCPVFLYGSVLNWIKNDPLKEYVKCNFVLVLVISVFVELSYIFSLSWHFIVLEYVLIAVIWIYVLKLKKFLTARFS